MQTPTYGTIVFKDNKWLITGEPFVKTRLKRVFPRAPQQASEHISLTASPENTRELQWFIQRYPMQVDRMDLMTRLAEEHRDGEILLAELLAGYAAPQEIVLAKPPRAYQALVPQFLQVRPGLLLADDLGLGKTVSAICAMVAGGNLPALVVCDAHLPRQWRNMIKEFAPALNVHILKKGTPYDLTPKRRGKQLDLLPPSMPDVIITSYHKLCGWTDTLKPLINLVVFDEAQRLRSRGTNIHTAAVEAANNAKRRLGLSATPIYNYGSEFWNVIDVLAPGALGDREEFIREWCKADGGDKARLSDPKEFGAYLRREGIMLRRTRKEVGRELPKLTKVYHEIESEAVDLEALKGDAVALARVVLRSNEQYRGEKMQAAGEFDALMRQATGIAKAPYVAQFVKLLLESGEPIVLFGWHRSCYDIWLEALAEFNPVLYTGTESATQKDEAVRKFTSGESQVLIMSLRSGAGVDGLQHMCSTAVIGELDWSPGVLEQCVGRVDRDGQETPCTAYYLVSDTGADPIMAEVLGVKREQIEGVRNPDGALTERIDTGENNLRRLAKQFLERRGMPVEADTTVVAIGAATAAVEGQHA